MPVVSLQLSGDEAREHVSEQKVTVVFGAPVDRSGAAVKVPEATYEVKAKPAMPALTLSARLVQVISDLSEEAHLRHRYGSGCIVSGRTVLIAAYVVAFAVNVFFLYSF